MVQPDQAIEEQICDNDSKKMENLLQRKSTAYLDRKKAWKSITSFTAFNERSFCKEAILQRNQLYQDQRVLKAFRGYAGEIARRARVWKHAIEVPPQTLEEGGSWAQRRAAKIRERLS